MWSKKPANRQVLWLVEWTVFFLWLLPEKVKLQKLQFSLRVFRVSKKLSHKMVPIFLGLRKNQLIS